MRKYVKSSLAGWPLILLLGLTLGLAGCGSDSSPTNPNGNNNDGNVNNPPASGMGATVDGTAWTADTASAFITSGIVIIGGADTGGTIGIGLGFQSTGAGTYHVGVGEVTNASVTGSGTGSWMANQNIGSGTITVTNQTADHITGTFEFTAPLVAGTGTPATRVVTNGVFDLDLTAK